jgi:LEA14-like dessication related protein
MKKIICLCAIIAMFGCSAIRERLAIKECVFKLVSVNAYDFTFSDMKVDFVINIQNPNQINATLDKLDYTFFANASSLFSGTTGQGVEILAGKSKSVTTTITLEYTKVGAAIVDAIKLKKAQYRVKATSYINTPIGPLSYPVDIQLK